MKKLFALIAACAIGLTLAGCDERGRGNNGYLPHDRGGDCPDGNCPDNRGGSGALKS